MSPTHVGQLSWIVYLFLHVDCLKMRPEWPVFRLQLWECVQKYEHANYFAYSIKTKMRQTRNSKETEPLKGSLWLVNFLVLSSIAANQIAWFYSVGSHFPRNVSWSKEHQLRRCPLLHFHRRQQYFTSLHILIATLVLLYTAPDTHSHSHKKQTTSDYRGDYDP